MIDFMALLSRYYFVFLIAAFVIVSVRYIAKKQVKPTGQRAVTILLIVFAFPILAFGDNSSSSLEVLAFGGAALALAVITPLLYRRVYKNSCPIIINTMVFLLSVGFVMLARLDMGLAIRQLAFATLGIAVAMLLPIGLRMFTNFEKGEMLYIGISIALLSLVSFADIIFVFVSLPIISNLPIISVNEFGAARWLSVGPLTFQPSEFVKPLFAVYLAAAFRTRPATNKLLFTTALSGLVIILLVLQRDLGNALMFFIVFMAVCYASTGKAGLVALGFALFTAASVFAYSFFAHLRVRVFAWQNPWADITGMGWQVGQSLFAIGSWGALGAGLGRGLPDRIPVVERDVIFSAIVEEFGWIFGLFTIAAYIVILLRGLAIATEAKRPFYALLSLSLSVFIVFQAFVAIGGNIKFIPMTGITLPYLSYGGSSVFIVVLITSMISWVNGQNEVKHG